MRKEIRIAGFGGQGVVSISILLAKTLGEAGPLHVAQTQSYGPEARGGACKAEVVIADSEIDHIKVLTPDVLVILSQPAMDAFAADLRPDTLLIYDPDMSKCPSGHHGESRRVPARRLAEEQLGAPTAANMIVFGALCACLDLCTPDAAKRTVENLFHQRHAAANNKAFDLGFGHGHLKKTVR